MSSPAGVVGVRAAGVAVSVLMAVVGFGWFAGAPWAMALQPWPEAPMSFMFLAAVAASIAVIWLWVALTGEVAALAGVGIYLLVVGGGAAAWLLTLHGEGRPGLVPALALSLGVVPLGLALWAWARLQPAGDPRKTPSFVRTAFVLLTLVLAIAAGALLSQRNVLPWPLQPETAPLFGFILLGTAAFFAHAAQRTRWVHAAPPLLGLLAGDLVLFVPCWRLLAGDAPAEGEDGSNTRAGLTSLLLFLAVLAASALLALYTLLVHPRTRLVARRA
jgi:hypothetical protein